MREICSLTSRNARKLQVSESKLINKNTFSHKKDEIVEKLKTGPFI
jgi:hypothetical protein